jgi:ribosomal-protein-alanine N-acetyltransferase
MTGGTQVLDGKRVSLLWAGPERAGDIARLHGVLFNPAWDEASVRRTLDHPAATSFVATLGGPSEVIGFIIGQIAADEAEILSIGVEPTRQRHGVGALLLTGLARAVQRAEVRRLFLEVAADNGAALALYTRGGFTATGLRKGYYARPGGTAVDAVTMSRPLAI